ncbi:MAG: hypothetical protein PVF30_11945, partial [Desulfobacterales bacterium]
ETVAPAGERGGFEAVVLRFTHPMVDHVQKQGVSRRKSAVRHTFWRMCILGWGAPAPAHNAAIGR